MMIPDNLTLEEFIGALKVRSVEELSQDTPDYQSNIHTTELRILAEMIKRELDRKQDK